MGQTSMGNTYKGRISNATNTDLFVGVFSDNPIQRGCTHTSEPPKKNEG